MTDEKEREVKREEEEDCDYYDPCCDPRFQELCEDDYYPEDYFGWSEDEDEEEEE